MNSEPPKIRSANTWIVFLIPGLLVLAGIATVFFFNPVLHRFYPVCQFHRLTGLNCPGCGGTRALYALLHGHFAAALHDNALLVGGAFLVAVQGGWFVWKKLRGQPLGDFVSTRFLWPLLAVALAFTVLRNLPAFSFLSP